MFFEQIISFILVLAAYEAHQVHLPEIPLWEAVLEAALYMGLVWLIIGWGTRVSLRRYRAQRLSDPGRAGRRLVALAHGVGVLGLVMMFTAGGLKAHIMQVPLIAGSQTLSGGFAVLLFFAVMLIVWHAVYPIERRILGKDLTHWQYVRGQARFLAPVAFPWLLVSLTQDAFTVGWPRAGQWLRSSTGDLVFLAFFLLILTWLFPPLVRHWWGCRTWPADQVRFIAGDMLRRSGVRVTEILSWPILEGRMITAGVLGVIPGARYLLITPALTEVMNPEELSGVFAHEAGHVRHRHMVYYMLFFLGFFVLAFASDGIFSLLFTGLFYLLSTFDWGLDLIISPKDNAWFDLLLALPVVLLLILYLRFVMGWFMRHFERQADLFAIGINGSAAPLISALEKIARISGQIRNAPSWHHFSVAQRVEALWRAQQDSGLIAAQARLIKKGLAIYGACLVALIGLGLSLDNADLQDGLQRRISVRLVDRELRSDPHNYALLLNLGILRMESGQEEEGLKTLGAALLLAPQNPEVMNTLAWFLVTAKDEGLRRPREALILAEKAVALLPPAPHMGYPGRGLFRQRGV